MSKVMLDKIKLAIRERFKQWKNTQKVRDWFKANNK